MTSIFELPINSEMLTQDEIKEITGASRKADQIEWLKNNRWTFFQNKAGEPVVGRLFTRIKLMGITPANMASGGWAPDFNKAKDHAA